MNDSTVAATVLVVEDDPLFLTLLCRMVEELGYQVGATASDGSDAVVLCRSIQPDLVLMDMMMPGLNGMDAATIIQNEQDVPIVLVSGLRIDDVSGRATRAPSGFLRKPFTLGELGAVLADHLDSGELQAAGR